MLQKLFSFLLDWTDWYNLDQLGLVKYRVRRDGKIQFRGDYDSIVRWNEVAHPDVNIHAKKFFGEGGIKNGR